MTRAPFGTLGGEGVEEVTLSSVAGAVAKIITFGAIVRDLVVPARKGPQRVVLGLERVEDYAGTARYMGAIVGRYGNRIGNGRFALDGKSFALDLNENGRQHLHGGGRGFAQRLWTVVDASASSVTLALVSADGDMGYPGRLVATCAYGLIEPATLRIVLEATADQPTPVNLTTHLYYNLDGGPDILDHELRIAAEHVTPTDDELIPTGEVKERRRHALRFPRLAPDPRREARRGGRIRPQLCAVRRRRAPRSRRDPRLATQRRRHGAVDDRARAAVLRRPQARGPGGRARRRRLRAPRRTVPRAAALPGRAEQAAFPPCIRGPARSRGRSASCASRRARGGVPLHGAPSISVAVR